MGIKSLTWHTIAFSHHIFALTYILTKIDYSKSDDPRIVEMEAFGPRYITTWNLLIQMMYLFLSVSLDISRRMPDTKPIISFRNSVEKCKGYIYTVILFPTTLFVALMFWSLFWINREWVMPEAADAIAPSWLNHSIHTNILLVIVLETILAKKALPRPSLKTAIAIFTAFFFIYFMQFFFTYYQLGRWMYGLFYDLTWTQRIVLILAEHAIAVGFLKIGFYIQSIKTDKAKSS